MSELLKEIKQLRQRIAAIDKRIANLERHPAALRVGKDSALYDSDNVPIGIWDVDSNHAVPRR